MDNKDFWEQQAKKHKDNVCAVNFDSMEEDLEFFFLDQLVSDGIKVCDIGCGNGRTILELARKKKNTFFYGVDFSPNMIEIANQQKEKFNLKNVNFQVADAISKDILNIVPQVDVVLSKRLLINIEDENRHKAIENIYSLLVDKGEYIMVECFLEPLNRINEIRKQLKLSEIKTKTFNQYLESDFLQLEQMKKRFTIKRTLDFESSYYYMSRIYNAYLSDGEPDYFSTINQLSVHLTKKGFTIVDGYGPEQIIILEKK
jgi:ubiquinone/menaquinone biosynthesis C-methylase UbiE